MKNEYLFVYGMLRRTVNKDMHQVLIQHADYVSEAVYQGKLYKVSYYPGAVPSDDPADVVHGEVYQLKDPDTVLPKLDQYEGCGPGIQEPTEYKRIKIHVRIDPDQTVEAWMYRYNRPVDHLALIISGDFSKL
jgi:gamma-glutamylcyclotransferase (GGCT)/AIG2-like uncharacterized protein YtfP